MTPFFLFRQKKRITKKKLCLPLCFLLMTFYINHNHKLAGHPGAERTLKQIERIYFFPGLSTWVKIFIYDCLECQSNKSLPGTHQLAPVQPFKEVSQYFNHRISIDTKGPLFPPSNGYNHLIVIIDAFTHYVVVNPVISAMFLAHFLTIGSLNSAYRKISLQIMAQNISIQI